MGELIYKASGKCFGYESVDAYVEEGKANELVKLSNAGGFLQLELPDHLARALRFVGCNYTTYNIFPLWDQPDILRNQFDPNSRRIVFDSNWLERVEKLLEDALLDSLHKIRERVGMEYLPKQILRKAIELAKKYSDPDVVSLFLKFTVEELKQRTEEVIGAYNRLRDYEDWLDIFFGFIRDRNLFDQFKTYFIETLTEDEKERAGEVFNEFLTTKKFVPIYSRNR